MFYKPTIINVFDGYSFKCHYFQCLNYIIIIMLTSTPWLFIIIIIFFKVFFLLGQIDPMLSMILGFFPFPKVSQLLSNLFISNMDHNGGFFFIFLQGCHNFHKI